METANLRTAAPGWMKQNICIMDNTTALFVTGAPQREYLYWELSSTRGVHLSSIVVCQVPISQKERKNSWNNWSWFTNWCMISLQWSKNLIKVCIKLTSLTSYRTSCLFRELLLVVQSLSLCSFRASVWGTSQCPPRYLNTRDHDIRGTLWEHTKPQKSGTLLANFLMAWLIFLPVGMIQRRPKPGNEWLTNEDDADLLPQLPGNQTRCGNAHAVNIIIHLAGHEKNPWRWEKSKHRCVREADTERLKAFSIFRASHLNAPVWIWSRAVCTSVEIDTASLVYRRT